MHERHGILDLADRDGRVEVCGGAFFVPAAAADEPSNEGGTLLLAIGGRWLDRVAPDQMTTRGARATSAEP